MTKSGRKYCCVIYMQFFLMHVHKPLMTLQHFRYHYDCIRNQDLEAIGGSACLLYSVLTQPQLCP